MPKTLALLREAVAATGLSLRGLAAELDMNHSHLSRILAGRVGIGAGTVGRLMAILDAKSGAALLETFLKEQREEVLSHQAETTRRRQKRGIQT
jgi:transcriptional regulator with XRE-family HTH domain